LESIPGNEKPAACLATGSGFEMFAVTSGYLLNPSHLRIIASALPGANDGWHGASGGCDGFE
jgi:hypothetical protein